MPRPKAPARNDRNEPSLFGVGKPMGKKVKGKRKPIKANVVMRVGGRKVSAAPKNKTKYKFPVIVTAISEAKSAAESRTHA
jgi:hypothetical protein